ncbi:ABC transporter permease [Streptomyces sp. NPDC093085]|uniref:ABC transporter permease n=1 Tax=Streptomyces sp. NPDC093085 TaxID=3155068 RepID=UPI003428CEC1
MLPLWVVLLGGSFTSVARSLDSLASTAAERAALAHSLSANSSLRALYGPVFSDSVGGLTTIRIGAFGTALAGVLGLTLVVRHTREEEESGRQEMLSAAMVGRAAPLTAALLTAVIAQAALALVIAGGLAGATGDPAGAAALGLAVGAAGLLFAATAAITAQLTENARLAKGLAGAVVGAAFVLKAAGDAATSDGSSPLTWASPLGWVEHVRPFADERWWMLTPLLAAAAVQALLAYVLAGRRDLGMSFLPARPGPAAGRLATAGGLAWRLQRGTLFGWGAGFLVSGVLFGGITQGAADLVGDNARTREIIERMGGAQGLTDAFLATMVSLLGMVAVVYVVGAVLRLDAEETAGRAEPVLAGAVGRVRWAAGHLLIAFAGTAVVMLLGGAGLYLGYGHDLTGILGATLVQLPAIWLLGALAAALYGTLPAATPAAWAATALTLALGWLGPALDLPDPVLDLSPFTHLPRLPGEPMTWPPVLWLTAVAGALAAAGLAGLRRRDVVAS